MIEVLSMKMSKFYEVHYLVRWAGYGKAYDSWVDEEVRVCQWRETNLNTFALRHASILTMNLR